MSEIKLALTVEGHSDDVRKVIKGFKEMNVNRAAAVSQLWEFCRECANEGVALSIAPFTPAERKEVACLLLDRLREEKEGKNIAAVLSVCTHVMLRDGEIRAPLVEGGLAPQLVEIINSHFEQLNVVEMGLQAASRIAMNNGQEHDLIGKRGSVVNGNAILCSLQLMVQTS